MKYIYMIFALLAVVSCTKHEDIIDTSFQPGCILCKNGSVIHPSQYDPAMGAVGVVFWCNDGQNPDITASGFAIALEDIGVDYLVDSEEDISGVTESETAFDGAANTTAIYTFALKDSISFPAVQLTMSYKPSGMPGWFIPSAAQCKAVTQNLSKVYQSFDVVGAQRFSGWYWTSTEDGTGSETPKVFGLISSLEEGRTTPSNKRDSHNVRPIIAIR